MLEYALSYAAFCSLAGQTVKSERTVESDDSSP